MSGGASSPARPSVATRLGRAVGLVALFCALAVSFVWPYFKGLSSTSSVREWIVLQSAAETTRRSLLDYHQLPQWDPWRCGGAAHLANPLVDVLSPWALVQALVGVPLSLRLHVYFHLLVAMLGAWWWARRRGLGALPSLGTALGFGLSGFFAASVAWGFGFLLPCAYLPLVMVAYEAARQRWRAAIGAGAVIALMLYEGGFASAQLAILLVLLRVAVDVASAPRRAAQPLTAGVLVVVSAVGLAAPKLLPVLLQVMAQPLPVPRADSLTLGQLATLFLGRDTSHWVKGFTFERYEYYAYLGPLVVAAALWGLWRARYVPYKELWALAGLMCLLLLGDQGSWLPYRWLVESDVLRWLVQVPSRLSVALALLLAMVFGHVLEALARALEERWPGRRLRYANALLVLALGVDLFWVSQGQWRHQPFSEDPLPREPGAFMLVQGDRATQYRLQLKNQGTLRCHQLTPVAVSKRLRPGPVPMAWLDDEAAGSALFERFSPNRLWLDVDLRREATVLVNQNWAAGWHVRGELPARVTSVDGLLAVTVRAGAGRVVLDYRTPGLLPGAVVGAGSALLVAALFALGWLGRRRDPYALPDAGETS